MKRNILYALAVCATLFACQKNEISETLPSVGELHATIEDDASTKTAMDENNNIRWSEGDQIVAFMRTSLGLKYQLKDSYAGETFGYFSKVSSGDSDDLGTGMEWEHNVAYYPYAESVKCVKSGDDYTLDVVLPTQQTYAPESFGNGFFPMLAVSEDNDITFKNVCGGMMLQFKGNFKVRSIKVQGKNGEKLSGAAKVTAYTDGAKPSIAMDSDASVSVVLNCGAGGVQLNENTATEFILALPPVVFTKGFSVIVTDSNGNSQTVETDEENVVLRSSLLVMPELDLEPVQQDPQAVLSLTYETTSANQTVQLTYNASECSVAGLENALVIIDYGDGTTGTSLSHTYSEAGVYEVQMFFSRPVTEIGEEAFNSCAELVGVQFPDGLTKIGRRAFEYSGLRGDLIIPENNVQIGHNAFSYTGEYENVIIPFGTDFSESYYGSPAQFFHTKVKIFYFGANIPDVDWQSSNVLGAASIEKLIIGNQVTSIGSCACGGSFYPTHINCIEFEEPSTLHQIGEAAFTGSKDLISITLPSSVQYINPNYVFSLCPKLESINVATGYNSQYWSDDGVLYVNGLDGNGLAIFRYPEAKKGDIFEKLSVRQIAPGAFRDNKSLKKVSVELVHGIGEMAFYGCSSLTEIEGCDYPYGDAYAYEIYIGRLAFGDCTSLTEFTIGLGVDVIRDGAFYGCTSLERIYCKPLTPPVLNDEEDYHPTFGDNAPGRLICVPMESLDLYKEAPGWNTYKDDIVGYIEVDGEIVIPSPDTPETPEAQPGDYVDEYGINHGQGVEIEGVVWAPVNCGYHARDYKYGKLYQWGRKFGQGYDGSLYDGDWNYIGEYADATAPELIGAPVSVATGQSEENANYFYCYQSDPYDWTEVQDDNLWNSCTEDNPVKTGYDPCPSGWRVPTHAELYELQQNMSEWMTNADGQTGYWFSGAMAYSETVPQVFFPAAGFRSYYDGYARDRGYWGYYWSSSTSSTFAYNLGFSSSSESISVDYGNDRAGGFSVRCVQE